MLKKKDIIVTLISCLPIMNATADEIKGRITDKETKEPLVGATIQIEASQRAAVTDIDGAFVVDNLPKGKYTLSIKYISYKSRTLTGIPATTHDASSLGINIEMESEDQALKEVRVTGTRRKDTEIAAVSIVKESRLVTSSVSAGEIKKTQDSNASEVIRRVPGVSLIEDKFMMVRGLSQRYNNVWINGGAVPSSEADSRAFSFDIIPSTQIDNLTIVKSPSAEYPADFSGGFVNITTKDLPSANSLTFTLGGNWNDATSFKSFSSKNDDNWYTDSSTPLGDLKLGAEWSYKWTVGESRMGMIGTANYTKEKRTFRDMQNNLYGVYDKERDRSNYLRHSTDDQYNDNSRLGAMLNFTLMSPTGNNKYEWKNILNHLVTDRYTLRNGVSAQSNQEQSAEYYHRSRVTYNGQLTGKHTADDNVLDWIASYSYANRRLPNRRRYLVDDALTEDGTLGLTSANDINIEHTKLDEHIVSATVNERHDFSLDPFTLQLQAGAYGEYRTRSYTTKEYLYNWDSADNALPKDFRRMDIPTLLSDPAYQGNDKLYLIEDMHMRNNYDGRNTLAAGYAVGTLPLGKLDIHAGLRYEYNSMELISNTRDHEVSHKSKFYTGHDLFPSINTTLHLNERHQMRLAYGKSVNRPEFREVSSSVYYDFDLASSVQGNSELKACYVQNLDLRYEWYPNRGETVSLAAFYKHFRNPIEWTYTVAGGTDLIYSYENAESANNIGVELDVRKSLDFIGLKNFSLSFNGALIHSRVTFEKGSRNEDRPMQGQSPYLINMGLFYKNERQQLSVSLLYNRIGKRIIGVGRSDGTTGNNEDARIPDSYEMPRNMIDLTLTKQFGQHLELKASIRDILSEKVQYKQFAESADGSEVEQITRRYNPGRNLGLSLTYKF